MMGIDELTVKRELSQLKQKSGIIFLSVYSGGIPFHNIKDEDLTRAISNHERMDWPPHISHEFNDIMLRCWHRNPESRPNFDLLYREMKRFVKHPKRHIKLKDYPFNVYIPFKPPDTNWEKMQDAFV
ncbi:hypothetical protein BSL78_00925 [Apostichopus japonicus]|uniref:Serine-threonine/tyrosine-protein kinase catalytic domain-containing protein n=1 Tax=Stichopus japonicus TaxID=307972 RepID=A0A2G8LPQ6_STIJA|nr:hypothetical protein BSL78_00925 [Apostichopus japonicus]